MSYDVIIVGGGLAGLALALALRRSRLTVALVEAKPPQQQELDARIYAVSPSNAAFLDEIGVWSQLDQQRIGPVRKMRVRGDRSGELNFSAYDSGVGELAWIIESSVMQWEMWQSAKRQGYLELICPATPAQLEIGSEQVLLTLNDQRQLQAKLIVAADGANSWVRHAAGIEVDFQPYAHDAVVANFQTEKAHREVAYQWFRHDGVLAYLPLPEKRISIVWSTPAEHARELLDLAPEALCQRVATAGEQVLGDLQLLTAARGFPLRLMRAPRTVAPRLALIGDAAHTIHPLSGHGINLGFQDAACLGAMLTACPEHIDCGDLQFLGKYQRARLEEVVALQSVTHGLQRLFGLPQPPLAVLRNAGLNFVDNLPFIKGILTRYAMG